MAGMSWGGMNPWGMGPPPAPYQQAYQQLAPNQQLALTQGMGSRGFYGPNSPTAAFTQALQGQMMGPGVGGAGMIPAQGMRDFISSGGADVLRRAYIGYEGMPQPMNPSIGLSDLVSQWQQGQMNPIAARQGLAGLAGVPNMGPGIGASQPQFQGPPPIRQVASVQQAPMFSPLRNEGYQQAGPLQAPAPTVPNQFTAQNRTRGMGGGMTAGRPTMPWANTWRAGR